jgi:hypothetical protein
MVTKERYIRVQMAEIDSQTGEVLNYHLELIGPLVDDAPTDELAKQAQEVVRKDSMDAPLSYFAITTQVVEIDFSDLSTYDFVCQAGRRWDVHAAMEVANGL